MIIMKTKSELLEERSQKAIEKMKLDRFFSMYLDKFGAKMDPEKVDTKVWTLYKAKLKEYSEVERQIKVLDYYINVT